MKFLTLALSLMLLASYCHTRASFRVRHGDTARLGQFPYVVLLYSGYSICTGSIVGPNKVLTAGHCVCGVHVMEDVITETITTEEGLDERLMYEVSSYSSNPKYNKECNKLGKGEKTTVVTGHDIAMITISGNFKFSKTVGQVKMAAAKPNPGDTMTIAGYGQDETGASGTLKFGTVTVKECDSIIQAHTHAVCYDFDENTNKHANGAGDSGGPMINSNGEVAGVTSGKIAWGGGKFQFGVHASTAMNMDYVKEALTE